MKLEFAYFDFTNDTKLTNGYRGLGECALNFSTKHNYSVERKNGRYIISRADKPSEERITEGFWGRKIYNITAIVGDNGSGKSTIIHELILALLEGNEPNAPFCLIFQDICYCSDINIFDLPNMNLKKITQYPEALKKLKCMLVDNTLTLASFQFDEKVNKRRIVDSEQKQQLFNKSQVASMRSGCRISYESRAARDTTVCEYIETYLKHESYQETRFLFDRSFWSLLKTIPVPLPDEVHIYVSNPHFRYSEMCNGRRRLNDDFKYFCKIEQDLDFKEKIYWNILLSYNKMFPQNKISAGTLREFNDNTKRIDKSSAFKLSLENALRHLCWDNERKNFYELVHLLNDKESCFNKIFSTQSNPKAQYSCVISIKELFENKEYHQLFSVFLDKYRAICDKSYFLTFNTGLSSGEKNLLKMLTQFRHLIDGPAYEGDARSENGVRNHFIDELNAVKCDTLFLFLDEADLTYHPEWQRSFVNMLSMVLPEMFGVYVDDIQVFLATHSPLMLGDFPDTSTIYLKRETDGLIRCNHSTKQSTFAQNLYYILKDGFYMNDSIGEFAKRKINEVEKWCHDVVETYDGPAKKKKWKKNLERTNEKIDAVISTMTNRQVVNEKCDELGEALAELKKCCCEYAKHLKARLIRSERTSSNEEYVELIKSELYDVFMAESDADKKTKIAMKNNRSEKVDHYCEEKYGGTAGQNALSFDVWLDNIKTAEMDEIDLEMTNALNRLDELPKMIETIQLLPQGLIRGKLKNDIERCKEVLSLYDNASSSFETLNQRKKQLEAELREVEEKLKKEMVTAE